MSEHKSDITAANHTHYEVGQMVRETIKGLCSTLPENLAAPDKSIKQIQKSTIPKLSKGKNKGGKDAS